MIRRAGLIVLGLLGACTVDDGFVDRDLFVCSGPADCGDGWGCVRASPYAADFCAPRCDGNMCDGICVRQQLFEGERELCLRGCRIREDGSTSECPGEDFSCIRVTSEGDEGVCYPVDACSGPLDCPAGHTCLSDLTEPVSTSYRTDNLYCVPEPTEDGACPARSIPVEINGASRLCLATCSPPDTRCPPGSGCLQQLALADPGSDVPCFPGLYGVPCDDDTNCLFGQCMDVGDAGRQCTITCDKAAQLAGGCGKLFNLNVLSPVFELECDPEAGSGEGGGLCVTRYGTGFLCTSPESEAYQCAGELECRNFVTADGEVSICTRECTHDSQCNATGDPSTNFCLRGGLAGGVCLPKRGPGGSCFEDGHCLAGGCVDGRCVGEA